jgi:signal transduction histidine kinase
VHVGFDERGSVHGAGSGNDRITYPAWIPWFINSGALGAGVVAVAQRAPDSRWLPAAALVLVALLPFVIELRGTLVPWPAFVVVTAGATALLMLRYPVDYDFAPFLLVMLVGCLAAYLPLWHSALSLVAALLALGVITYFDDSLPFASAAIWFGATSIGWDVGFVIRHQQLRIQQQAREYTDRARQAALEERQRIAREVHDLVAHSLSVTMLHLTAARRDLEEGGDVAEAAEALREAERVGRQAVSDVRRTVGLLGQPGGLQRPAPSVADIPALVEELRAAGMVIELTLTGDPDEVPPATALGLYRTVQESLANVAKHSRGASVSVRLDLASDPGRLTIRNPVPRGATRGEGGSGLRGMTERAELLGATLTAGPQGDDWVVSMELPRGDTLDDTGRDAGEHVCPLPRLTRALRRPAPDPT